MIKELNTLFNRDKSYYINKIRADFPIFNFKQYKKIILFGAAYAGNVFFDLCKKNSIEIIAVCDNDPKKVGTLFNGVKIISLKDLEKFPKSIPIVVTIMHDYIVRNQLKILGFINVWSHAYFSVVYPEKFDNHNFPNSVDAILRLKNKILSTLELFQDFKSKQTFIEMIKYRLSLKVGGLKKIAEPINRQYFSPDIINLQEEEVFIDGGAYIGDTIVPFLRYSKNKFRQILAFEPDQNSFRLLSKYVHSLKDKRISILPHALSSKNELLRINFQGSEGSRIIKNGISEIKSVTLDDYKKYKPTFIKLDIEGFEREALMGARKIIKEFKPKLAICVYHKPSDLWVLPNFIKKINPEYKLYIRQYSVALHDTICYAV